ncbi:MAG: flippase-like domain-containing protein [Chloroflexi bacterium]|nr:flippase-like domain-containing protein [Chloroflexota bacterium]
MLNKAKIVGVVLALVFLGIALWKIDITELGNTIASADYRFVAPAALLTFLGYVWRTYRWKRILHPTQSIPVRRLFPVLMIGFMANNVLPARVGEFVRAYTLHKQEAVSKSSGLATIFLERVCDGLTLVMFLAVLSLSFPLPPWGTEAAYFASAVFLCVGVFILAVLLWEDLALTVVRLCAQPFPDRLGIWLLSKTSFFIDGLRALRRRRAVLVIVASSLVVWVLEATSYYLIIRGFAVPLSGLTLVLAAIFLLVMVNLGTMLPSAPGYVGTFQLFGVLALSAFDVKREVALSIALVSHSMQYVLVTAIGLFFFWKQNLSLRKIGSDAIKLTD